MPPESGNPETPNPETGANGGGNGWARKPAQPGFKLAPMKALRYSTEVPYPEENALGQPANNANSWMGTNVAWSGRTPHPSCLPASMPPQQMPSPRPWKMIRRGHLLCSHPPSKNANPETGANGGGNGWARKPAQPRFQVAPMRALRYSTEVPYPEENALGQPSNNANSWMGTYVAWSGRAPHPSS